MKAKVELTTSSLLVAGLTLINRVLPKQAVVLLLHLEKMRNACLCSEEIVHHRQASLIVLLPPFRPHLAVLRLHEETSSGSRHKRKP